jgi:hypothetical protein
MDFFSSPAFAVLVVAVIVTFTSTSISSLLFFWRYKTTYVAVGTPLIIVVIYGGLIALCATSNSPLTFLQWWPAEGGDKLGTTMFALVVAAAGVTLGILFIAVARVADFLDDRRQ